MTTLLFILALVTFNWFAASQTCTTADGDQGTCMVLDQCPLLLNKLQTNPTPALLKDVQDSSCEGPERYNVCCSTAMQTSPPVTSLTQECQLTAYPPKPSTQCCGVDASSGQTRIVGGNETGVYEYPWLALIEYRNNNVIELLCGGVLISGQYVLTAAHCVAGKILNDGTPVKVRLGEHDWKNDGPDCITVEGGGKDCNEGALSVPIKEITPYPRYDSSSRRRRHDIALIKLVRTVQFTTFIRPICLPTTDFTKEPQENLMLYAAGWGAVSKVQYASNIKMKVSLPYVPYEDCQASYNTEHKVKLWEGQICAGGVTGKDTCNGDSGGPLMRSKEERLPKTYELVGIVSFGPSACGKENVPGVYTKVYHYLPWIIDQIYS